jgi:hypothetical protein
MAPFDGSPRCNVAVAIGGEPDMQMVVRGDHIGADDPFRHVAARTCCSAIQPPKAMSFSSSQLITLLIGLALEAVYDRDEARA